MGENEAHPSGAASARSSQQAQREAEDAGLRQRMKQIQRKLLVMSGKGGVGKSTVAARIALGLHALGKRTGLLDVDIHGPSIPHIMGMAGMAPEQGEEGILPLMYDGMAVMSIGFMLQQQDTPLIWRGPIKTGIIRQFLGKVEWGELDALVVDCPPGTGDEPLTVGQLIPDAVAVIVTTPQRLALSDVRKCIEFCRKLNLPIAGIVQNMSGLICPDCGRVIEPFGSDGGRRMAEELEIPFLGSAPLVPEICAAADRGAPERLTQNDGPAGEAFNRIVEKLVELQKI